MRLPSTTRKIPSGSTSAFTCRRFSMENGWPPIRLVVASMRTKETLLGPAWVMASRSRARSMFPLKGCALCVFSELQQGAVGGDGLPIDSLVGDWFTASVGHLDDHGIEGRHRMAVPARGADHLSVAGHHRDVRRNGLRGRGGRQQEYRDYKCRE